MTNGKTHIIHRFLDEAGDCTFYGKKRKNILGTEGVSNCFILGMVKFKEDLQPIRVELQELQMQIANDPYFQVASVVKKKKSGGYFFHAKDDIPEIRKIVFDFILKKKLSFEAVVARKSIERFTAQHKDKEQFFYADVLSHLLKNKMQKSQRLVLNIAEKGTSTKNNNLEMALEKAKERFAGSLTRKSINESDDLAGANVYNRQDIKTGIVFNVTKPVQEPLLNIADYLCWTIQRVFEKGETRYYDYMLEKISQVIDLYDKEKYEGFKNYYSAKNPLTAENKISPQLH
jgi:hypothetical protein